RFAFTASKHVHALDGVSPALPPHVQLDRTPDGGDAFDSIIARTSDVIPPVAPDQVASLLYTSGTTGTPKAVPLTHHNLASDASALIAEKLIAPADRVLMPLPLHHTYPFTVGMLMVLGLGAQIVMPAGITGPEITGAAKRSNATAMLGVPSLYEAVWQSIDARV